MYILLLPSIYGYKLVDRSIKLGIDANTMMLQGSAVVIADLV